MAKRNRKTGQTIAYKTLHRKLKTKVLRNGKQFRLHYIASVVLQTMISYDWGGGGLDCDNDQRNISMVITTAPAYGVCNSYQDFLGRRLLLA